MIEPAGLSDASTSADITPVSAFSPLKGPKQADQWHAVFLDLSSYTETAFSAFCPPSLLPMPHLSFHV